MKLNGKIEKQKKEVKSYIRKGKYRPLLRLLLKVTKVTTQHQKWPKMGQNSKIGSLFARRGKKASAEGQSPPQELEVGPRSGPYLLVTLIIQRNRKNE